MLVLTVAQDRGIQVGEASIWILGNKGGKIKVGISAPRSIQVDRIKLTLEETRTIKEQK